MDSTYLRITRLREQRRWTKAELARQARINQSTLGLIENGRLLPYPSQLQKLAQALGVSEADSKTLLEEVSVNA